MAQTFDKIAANLQIKIIRIIEIILYCFNINDLNIYNSDIKRQFETLHQSENRITQTAIAFSGNPIFHDQKQLDSPACFSIFLEFRAGFNKFTHTQTQNSHLNSKFSLKLNILSSNFILITLTQYFKFELNIMVWEGQSIVAHH